MKPVEVETWLGKLPYAPATRAKVKSVMYTLFRHAVRYELAQTNPIQLVRQSAKPLQEKPALTAEEVEALLMELNEPFRTILLVACTTGLRRGELFGLKWQDINFASKEIRVQRSVVDQVEGPTKTQAARASLPMSPEVVFALQALHERTEYKQPHDWLFASPVAMGKLPYWPDAVLKRHIRPAAERAKITKTIGWHSFRRTFATLLQSWGASMKTTQELMRHANPNITLGLYAKGVTSDKREAQNAIATMFSAGSQQATGNITATM